MKPHLLHHSLCVQSAQTPDRPFLDVPEDGEDGIGYGELADQMRRLASGLASRGIGRHSRIGIYLPKGSAAYIAIFATLELGGAYVPLDVHAPLSRIREIVHDCRLHALVAEERLAAALLAGALPESLVLLVSEGALIGPVRDRPTVVDWETALAEGSTHGSAASIEDDLAYILYTSGSTGRPKGVMISHRAALAFVDWAVAAIGLESDDRVAAVASLHFDLSIFDLFATVSVGATLIPVPPGLLLRPEQLVVWLVEKQITVWYSTPSTLILLLTEGKMERHEFPHLRRILFAGEVFPVKYLRQLQRVVPGAMLFNLYGPTETNVCLFKEVGLLPEGVLSAVPIGRACSNVEVVALDEQGCEVEAGQEGELWVRGATVMLGYWGDRDRTSAVLRPQPHLDPSGGLWYRTGDLVHRDASGEYHFHGRRDSMVKVRGYRVELGEVELALSSHPDVREQAVVVVPNVDYGVRLRAYVVVEDPKTCSLIALKAYLGERLPAYMIPAEIRYLESLPKTSTGKVDRQALVAAA
jgi:amino acid adenylation domain-containing protein